MAQTSEEFIWALKNGDMEAVKNVVEKVRVIDVTSNSILIVIVILFKLQVVNVIVNNLIMLLC